MAVAKASVFESTLQRLSMRLRATSMFVSPALMRSPFDGYGVVAAGEVMARAKSVKKKSFGVSDARERLVEFIDGRFTPKSFGEVVDYLASRFMHFELRIFDGRAVNFIVDTMSRKAVPASQVDPRLSRPGLARMFGRSMDVKVARPKPLTAEQIDAKNLRAKIAGRLRSPEPNGTPFIDWDDATFAATALFQDRELTVQGDEVWVGFEYARASADPAENLRIVERAKAEGVKLLLPAETKANVASGNLVPGMPIILRRGAVRTRLIDKSISFVSLTEVFGVSPFDHYRAMAASLRHRRADAVRTTGGKVVDIDGFRKLVRKPAEKSAVAAAAGVPTAACVVKHEMDAQGREVMVFVDPRTGDEFPFDAVKAPVGLFKKEDAFGLPSGFVQVAEDKTCTVLDEDARMHNPFGPAILPPKGSGLKPSFAWMGEAVSASQFADLSGVGAGPATKQAALPRRAEPEAVDATYDLGFFDEVEPGSWRAPHQPQSAPSSKAYDDEKKAGLGPSVRRAN